MSWAHRIDRCAHFFAVSQERARTAAARVLFGVVELMSDEEAELAKLRWRARRGMLELDVLFARYLDAGWCESTAAEREAFVRLLACEDTALWQWLTGREHAEDADLDALVQKIRAVPPPK